MFTDKLSAMNSGKYNKGGIVQMLNYGGEAEEYMPNNSSLTVAEMKGKMFTYLENALTTYDNLQNQTFEQDAQP